MIYKGRGGKGKFEMGEGCGKEEEGRGQEALRDVSRRERSIVVELLLDIA